MDDIQKQVVERLKQANNILVTVRNDPSIDLLSACIGLALVLDKLDKHAAAVFSGAVPSAMEFLRPEDTIERTPDSLRDFIIALDKSKADKLRYKVEDKVVRIFITPYKTSLSEKDLEFSQGDFNVDAVVALGAHEQEELDQAITVHGRILHDAVVISINNTPSGNLGSLSWQDVSASSISEMVSRLVKDFGSEVLDGQIATALLTGIVAETERFSNEKTTPETMNVAGELMAAGANQQLVANSLQTKDQSKLSAVPSQDSTTSKTDSAGDDGNGTLDIDHEGAAEQEPIHDNKPVPELSKPAMSLEQHDHELLPMQEPSHDINDVHGSQLPEAPFTSEYADEMPASVRSYLVDDPVIPSNTPKPAAKPVEPSEANPFDTPVTEPLAPIIDRNGTLSSSVPASLPPTTPLPSISSPVLPLPTPLAPGVPASPLPPFPQAPVSFSVQTPTEPTTASLQPSAPSGQTLEEIEESVHSPHVVQAQEVDAARSQVASALQQNTSPTLEPLASLNANPLGDDLHHNIVDPLPSGTPQIAPTDPAPIEVDADGNLKQVGAQPSAPPVMLPSNKPFPGVLNGPAVQWPLQPAPLSPPPVSPALPPSSPPPLAPPNLTNPST